MNIRNLLLASLAAFALQASAQDATPPPAQAPGQTPAVAAMPPGTKPQDVAKELGLTDKQVEDLFRLDNEHGERVQQLHRQNLDTPTKRARITELRDQKQADIQKVMTPEQWAKWQQMRQAQRDASLKAREERKAKTTPVHQE